MIKKFTKHAIARMQQRGKSQEGVKLVLRHGTRRPDRDGYLLRHKEADRQIERRQRWLARLEKRGASRRLIRGLRRRMQIIERMRGCVVVPKDGKIITVYNRARRHKNTLRPAAGKNFA